jgi:hypothetical protein
VDKAAWEAIHRLAYPARPVAADPGNAAGSHHRSVRTGPAARPDHLGEIVETAAPAARNHPGVQDNQVATLVASHRVPVARPARHLDQVVPAAWRRGPAAPAVFSRGRVAPAAHPQGRAAPVVRSRGQVAPAGPQSAAKLAWAWVVQMATGPLWRSKARPGTITGAQTPVPPTIQMHNSFL